MNTQASEVEIDPAAPLAPSGQEWGVAVRTCQPGGYAYGGFKWATEPGSIVCAPDFDPSPKCGKGLHLNPWGIGNWALHDESGNAIWMLVRFDPALAIDLDGDKIEVPWAIVDRVEPAAKLGVILHELAKVRAAHLRTLTSEAMTSGDSAHAATSGYRAHAATTGVAAIASALGWYGAAKASAGGAIVLAEYEWDDGAGKPKLIGVFSSLVGENGIEPDTLYTLRGGKPVAVSQ